ncbi:MAG TPA: hypothetical protein PL110_20530 [Candidatus Eremiobacteraeota bacterium]|nr:hypothetical protein [Candidatus Eremiobacteraeota bacterium]
MECPRCRSKIPQGSVNYPECGKPLATFPINEIQKQQAGFNPMWFIYGGCGCVFLIGVLILLLLILGILIVPPL